VICCAVPVSDVDWLRSFTAAATQRSKTTTCMSLSVCLCVSLSLCLSVSLSLCLSKVVVTLVMLQQSVVTFSMSVTSPIVTTA